MSSKNACIHLVGFGSQGSAWAQALKASGWDVFVYLKERGRGFEAAEAAGFSPALLSSPSILSEQIGANLQVNGVAKPALVALLIPDADIGPVYEELVSHIQHPLTVVIGHGYAVYSGDLKPRAPLHDAALFAPKAIGPQLSKKYGEYRGTNIRHELVAATAFPTRSNDALTDMALAMGFLQENLVAVTFEQETIGDLISEQGLLCGGLFTLMEWTLEAMERAHLPPKLLRAECLTELGLIVDQMIEKGPRGCFKKISQAAQCGATLTKEWLEKSGAKEAFLKQVEGIERGEFSKQMKDLSWKTRRDAWLEKWEGLEGKMDPKTEVHDGSTS